MTKETFSRIGTTVNAPTEFNGVIGEIETALDGYVKRDGESPNSMQSALDMNSYSILNLPAPRTLNEPLRLADADLVSIDFVTISDSVIQGSGPIVVVSTGQSNAWNTDTGTFSRASNLITLDWSYLTWDTDPSTLSDPFFNWPNSVVNGGAILANEIAKIQPHRSVYYLRLAYYGAPIEYWIDPDPAGPDMYSVLKTNIEWLLARLGISKIHVFHMDHGESAVATYSTYKERRETLSAMLRAETWFGEDTIEIVGNINSETNVGYEAPAGYDNVRQQIVDYVAADSDRRLLVDRGDLTYNVDTVHLDGTGLEDYGLRLFNALTIDQFPSVVRRSFSTTPSTVLYTSALTRSNNPSNDWYPVDGEIFDVTTNSAIELEYVFQITYRSTTKELGGHSIEYWISTSNDGGLSYSAYAQQLPAINPYVKYVGTEDTWFRSYNRFLSAEIDTTNCTHVKVRVKVEAISGWTAGNSDTSCQISSLSRLRKYVLR